MEKFFSLRAEKQEHIINAALTVFARNGYKKTSTADIAEAAGIAKGMIFYYFGSKKNLYLYLIGLCTETVTEEMEKHLDKRVTDYFGRIRMMTKLKVAVMKRRRATMLFLTSVFYETDTEVADEAKKRISEGMGIRDMWLLGNLDASRWGANSKFKDGVDPKLLEKLLVWAGVGMGYDLGEELENFDSLADDFYKCLDMLEKFFYREEYQK